jgi:hypothetical protein
MRLAFIPHDTFAPADRKKRKKYFAWLFLQLATLTDLEIRAHVVALSTNTITPNQFGAQMLGTLQMAHPRAWTFGAQSQGASVVLADGVDATRDVVKAQADFLQGFIDDLTNRDPRYVQMPEYMRGAIPNEAPGFITDLVGERNPSLAEIEYRATPIENRALLYNERVRGSANRGALDALPPWAEIDWVLGPNEDHCEDCPMLAKNGPYRPNTLPTLPGEGMTECLVNCRCHLKIDGFPSIDF